MAQHKLVQYDSMAASMTLGPMGAGTQRMVMGTLGMGRDTAYCCHFQEVMSLKRIIWDKFTLLVLATIQEKPQKYGKIWQNKTRGSRRGLCRHIPVNEIRFRKLIEWLPKALEVRREHCGSL